MDLKAITKHAEGRVDNIMKNTPLDLYKVQLMHGYLGIIKLCKDLEAK